jgi:hypothetical protein
VTDGVAAIEPLLHASGANLCQADESRWCPQRGISQESAK